MTGARAGTGSIGGVAKQSAGMDCAGRVLKETADAAGNEKPGQQWHWHKGEHQSPHDPASVVPAALTTVCCGWALPSSTSVQDQEPSTKK